MVIIRLIFIIKTVSRNVSIIYTVSLIAVTANMIHPLGSVSKPSYSVGRKLIH